MPDEQLLALNEAIEDLVQVDATAAAPAKRVGPRCDVHRIVWPLIGHLIGHFVAS